MYVEALRLLTPPDWYSWCNLAPDFLLPPSEILVAAFVIPRLILSPSPSCSLSLRVIESSGGLSFRSVFIGSGPFLSFPVLCLIF